MCKRNGIQCLRLSCPFTCSDCGSPYKASIKLLNDEIDSGNLDDTQKGMCGGVPDAIHMVKCICCSLTDWFSIFDNHRINLAFLRTLRESDLKLGKELRELLPLDSLREKDRMDSLHPLQVSSTEVWSLFSCKKYCSICFTIEVAIVFCDDCRSLCTNNICQKCVIVLPLVPERWRLAKDNQEGVIKSPLSICSGPPSIFFVCHENNIFSVRLHYPLQVTKVLSNLEKCSAVCYWKESSFSVK